MKWFANHDVAPGSAQDEPLPLMPHVVADRACCCPGRPVVTVIMPPTPSRPHPVDLLMCGHHFRASRAALLASGATAYDEQGAVIMGYTGGETGAEAEDAPVQDIEVTWQ
jgi:hypothetical protein